MATDQKPVKWHTIKTDIVLKNLKSSETGLTTKEAGERLQQFGKNILPAKKRKTPLAIFLGQFKSVLIFLLVAAAGISFFVGANLDGYAIVAILLINAFLGFHQEYKAEKALEGLQKLLILKVRVIRNNIEDEISADDLVQGDIIVIEEGDKIPADIRLLEVSNLTTNEASLTGESTPISKITDTVPDAQVAERKNMLFAGTVVSSGRAKGIVTATGANTEFGKIAALIQDETAPTPLQIKLNKFGKILGVAITAIAALIFGIGISENIPVVSMLLTSISLAVAAVPEGLPAVITLTLALGSQKLAKKNALVRRLGAAEALGSVDVICADKTGTMTTNEMTVKKIYSNDKFYEVTGVGFKSEGEIKLGDKKVDARRDENLLQILKISKMCNNAIIHGHDLLGDTTELALKVLATKAGMYEDYKRLKEIPFSSERKMMSTANITDKGEVFVYSKGAPEILLKHCEFDNFGRKLIPQRREKILNATQEMASKGLRVLAFAYKKLGKGKVKTDELEYELVFAGLVGMIDPPRKETKESIRLCQSAGIRVMMLTGDHRLTAEAIAHDVGITGKSIAGDEIDKLNNYEFYRMLDDVSVFARLSPEHKLKIVSALKKKGHTVAVTGDGVNDAPALKKADIGVAMGIKGTDATKEVSDMILLDDNFATIVSAVEEGRGIFDNIKKFVRYLLAANLGELLIITLALFARLPLPLLPLQILWVNLVTDGLPALALAVEPKEDDVMRRKPTKEFLKKSTLFIIVAGIVSAIVSLSIFAQVLPIDLEKARTMVFTTLVMFELLLVFNSRSETKSIFRNNPLTNPQLIGAVLLSLVLQLAVIYVPFMQNIFGTVALSLNDWGMILGFSAFALVCLPELLIRKQK